MDAATARRLLGLLGLGVRARNAVIGVERVRDAARRGRLALAVVAPDASRHSREKVIPLLTAKRVMIVEGPSAAVLGSVVGRESCAAIGITDKDLARGVRRLLKEGGGAGRSGSVDEGKETAEQTRDVLSRL